MVKDAQDNERKIIESKVYQAQSITQLNFSYESSLKLNE